MKALIISFLSSSLFLCGSDKLGPNPSMKKVVEPEDRVVSFKKPEFITKYKELVDNKAAKKALDTQKPLKYLSPDLFEKWKQAGNLLIVAVNADASFEQYTNGQDKDLIYYATELRKEIAALSKQTSIIMEQYPILIYKKPLFKSEPKYKGYEIDSARTAVKNSSQALSKISTNITRISMDIQGILDKIPTDAKKRKAITAAQEEIYKHAAEFADKVANLALLLANEINAIP